MTPKAIAALALAVDMAADWRGSYTGDLEMLMDFDKELLGMRRALADLRREHRAAVADRRAARKVKPKALQRVPLGPVYVAIGPGEG